MSNEKTKKQKENKFQQYIQELNYPNFLLVEKFIFQNAPVVGKDTLHNR